MEATIRITVTTIIISRSEKPSGRLVLFPLGRCVRRPIDAISTATPDGAHTSRRRASRRMRHPPKRPLDALSITTHRQQKLDSEAATAELPLRASPRLRLDPP